MTMSVEVQNLYSRIQSLNGIASEKNTEELRGAFNKFTNEYKDLKLTGTPEGSGIRRALDVFKKTIIRKQASGKGQNSVSLSASRRRCQPLTFIDVDKGLLLSCF